MPFANDGARRSLGPATRAHPDERHVPMMAAITVRSETTEWLLVQAFAESFAAQHGFSSEDRARLLIVLEELLTNLAKFGFDAGAPAGTAEIGLVIEARRLVITFVDD